MSMFRTFTIVVVGVCCSAAALADTSFEATEQDKDLQTLVTRWAKGEGKRVVWEAKWNAAIKDVDALNSDARLRKAASFTQALDRLNVLLSEAHAENPSKPVPMVACVFDDAIVIRTVTWAGACAANEE